jgi:hypothetical protein
MATQVSLIVVSFGKELNLMINSMPLVTWLTETVTDVLNCPESDGSSCPNVTENPVLRNINIDNKFLG